MTDNTPKIDGVEVLSPSAIVLDDDMPLKEKITVSIAALVPQHLQTKCCMAIENNKGKYHYAGGYYAGGRVYCNTRKAGRMVVVADDTAPEITPNWRSGASLRGAKRISFRVTDNFSGIDRYELYIDGEWKTLNYAPLQSTLYHTFDTPLCSGVHTLKLRVVDGVGNIAIFTDKFYR